MSTITLNLPDALVEKLEAMNVGDISSFATDALWHEIEERQNRKTEEEIESTVSVCKESLAEFDRGEFIRAEDFIAKRLKARETKIA